MDHHCDALILESWPVGPVEADPPLPWDVYWEYAWAKAWQIETGGQPTMFVFRSLEKVFVHSFLVHPIPEFTGVDLETPYGYGGPLANSEDPHFLEAAWKGFADWAIARGVVSEFIRFHPLLDNIRFVKDPCYSIGIDRETICTSPGVGEQLSVDHSGVHPSDSFRRGTIHALKAGLSFSELSPASHLPFFIQLYEQTMKRIQAEKFYFFSPQHWDSLLVPDLNVKLFGVHAGERLAAGALCLMRAPFLHFHLGASDGNLLPSRPNNLLFHGMKKWAADQAGLTTLHLGGGSDSSPDNSLLRFKAGVGGCHKRFYTGRRIWNPTAYESLKTEAFRRFPELRQHEGKYLQIHRLAARLATKEKT